MEEEEARFGYSIDIWGKGEGKIKEGPYVMSLSGQEEKGVVLSMTENEGKAVYLEGKIRHSDLAMSAF